MLDPKVKLRIDCHRYYLLRPKRSNQDFGFAFSPSSTSRRMASERDASLAAAHPQATISPEAQPAAAGGSRPPAEAVMGS
jgi:hypothetical protein